MQSRITTRTCAARAWMIDPSPTRRACARTMSTLPAEATDPHRRSAHGAMRIWCHPKPERGHSRMYPAHPEAQTRKKERKRREYAPSVGRLPVPPLVFPCGPPVLVHPPRRPFRAASWRAPMRAPLAGESAIQTALMTMPRRNTHGASGGGGHGESNAAVVVLE